jgi:hypothetical protein
VLRDRQNTFTGKLTRPMLRRIFVTAKRLTGSAAAGQVGARGAW